MSASAEDLRREYDDYDRKVDIVSSAEVWFTKSKDLTPTVKHFERFPRFSHPDGELVTPEFTVLFDDGTGVIGEISRLARHEDSLDSLAHQVSRYETLEELPVGEAPGGGHVMAPVSEIDIVIFVPHSLANFCIDRLDAAISDEGHAYTPANRPMILAWSYDTQSQSYAFVRDERGGKNPPIRSHGRSPSLTDWLATNSDTLTGVPRQFLPIKIGRRFMNDAPPELYTATVLWAETIPSMMERDDQGEPKGDLETTAAELAQAMRDRYGFGRAAYVEKVLRFLRRAGLAVDKGDCWMIRYHDLTRSASELHEALIARVTTKSRARAVATRQTEETESTPEPATLLDQGGADVEPG